MRVFKIILFLFFIVEEGVAEEVVDDDYRDGLIESVRARPTFERLPVQVPRPTPRPLGVSAVRPRTTQPEWQGGQPRADFSRIESSMTSQPIWPKFAALFVACARGCAPDIWSVKGSRSGKSCHTTGSAVDLRGIKCGGVVSKPGSARFNNFVTCTRTKKYEKRKWKVLYQETHKMKSRDCTKWRGLITKCHWDHVHLDVGC